MKNNQKKELELKKLKIAKLSNLHTIKGGGGLIIISSDTARYEKDN